MQDKINNLDPSLGILSNVYADGELRECTDLSAFRFCVDLAARELTCSILLDKL